MTLYQILASTGYRVSENEFPDNSGVAPPFIIYERNRSNNLPADNKVYYRSDVVTIRLVSLGRTPNKTAKAALESALNTNELPFEVVDGFYVENQGTFELIYETGARP